MAAAKNTKPALRKIASSITASNSGGENYERWRINTTGDEVLKNIEIIYAYLHKQLDTSSATIWRH